MITFDNTPSAYWLLGYCLVGVVIYCAYNQKVPNLVFVLLGLLLFTFMRMPVLLFNRELNADESQMISHALTLFQDPVYWRSVDGTTIGPLDNYYLILPKYFGFPLDYTSARVMGLIANLIGMTLLFGAFLNWFSKQEVRAIWLAPLLLLSFSQENDFVHYSSEQIPILLLSVSLWAFSQLHSDTNHKLGFVFLLGLIIGTIPFSKLQAVPLATIITLGTIWEIYRLHKARFWRLFLVLGAAIITFPLLTFLWAYWNGVLWDLIDFYILGNLIYAGGNNEFSILESLWNIVKFSPDFLFYFFVLLIPIVVSSVTLIKNIVKKYLDSETSLSLVFVLLTLSSIYSIVKSGNSFVHYLNFGIIPLALCAATGLAHFKRRAIIIPIFITAWFLYNDINSYQTLHQINSFNSVGKRTLPESSVIKEVKKYTESGDHIGIWGWQCAYYVEAQLAQATAENHSERSIFLHKMQEKYRKRYLTDLQRTKPKVFLDAVGKNSHWVQDTLTQNIQCFPKLANYIKTAYDRKGIFDGTVLYVRKDLSNQ